MSSEHAIEQAPLAEIGLVAANPSPDAATESLRNPATDNIPSVS
jgi:hypothetical protein